MRRVLRRHSAQARRSKDGKVMGELSHTPRSKERNIFCGKGTCDFSCMCTCVAKQSEHRESCGGSDASAGGAELAIAAARDMTERTIDAGCIAVSTLSSMFFCFACFCACRCNSNALCCLLTDVANRRIRGGVKSRGTPAMHYRLSCIGYGHCGSSHFRV